MQAKTSTGCKPILELNSFVSKVFKETVSEPLQKRQFVTVLSYHYNQYLYWKQIKKDGLNNEDQIKMICTKNIISLQDSLLPLSMIKRTVQFYWIR